MTKKNSADGWITIGVELDSKEFDTKTKDLKNKMSEADNSSEDLEKSLVAVKDSVQQLNTELDKVEKGLSNIEEKMERIKDLTDKSVDITAKTKTEDASKVYHEAIENSLEAETEQIEQQLQEYISLANITDEYENNLEEIKNKDLSSKIILFKNKIEESEYKARSLKKDMADTREIINNMTGLLYSLNNGLLTEEQIIKKVNDLSSKGFDISFNGNVQETVQQLKELTELYLTGFTSRLEEQEAEYRKINNDISLYKTRLMEAESQHYKLSDVAKKSLDSIGNSVEGVIKKFVKWGLAIVGIRSVMSFIRSSMSTLSQYDNQLSTDLEYIRWTLAQALKPIIEWIMKAIVTIIRLVNTLVYRLFGVNLLADSTPEKFKKAKDQLSKAKDEAKELRKQLAGFDEMNILGDNTKTSNGVSSTDLPGFDLSKLFTDKELKELWEKIKKKVDDLVKLLKEKIKKLIDEIFNYINDKFTINNIFEAGLGILGFLMGETPEEVVMKAMKMALNVGKVVIEAVKVILKIGEVLLSKNSASALLGPIKKLIQENPIALGFKGLDLTGAKSKIDGAIKNLNTSLNSTGLSLNKIDTSKIINAFSGLPGKASTAYTAIKNVFSALPTFFSTTFSNAWKKVLDVFKTNGTIFVGIKEAVTNVFKKAVNGIFDGIDKVINKPFEEINGVFNSIRSTSILGIKPFSFIKKNLIPTVKLPRLATGGIINMPGRGVALGGELGPEGVIPMTNKSAMELLGRTIGEYVTINANITNNMNGRLISRVLREVNAQQDFLYNR